MVVKKKRPGQKKTRRQKSLAGTGTNEITIDQHAKAWKMWVAGVDPRDVQRECRLTARQWAWLFRTGAPENGMPSFESLWLQEVTEIRSQAVESAKEIGSRSPEVIRLRMENAGRAGALLSKVLDKWKTDMEGGQSFEQAAPSEDGIKAMKVLASISDGKAAAEMFRSIYSDGPGLRAIEPTADDKKADPMSRVSDPEESEEAPREVSDGFWRMWSRMSKEDKARYIADGTEPDPKDLIDVQAREK